MTVYSPNRTVERCHIYFSDLAIFIPVWTTVWKIYSLDGGHSYCIWKDIIISLLSLFWDESGSFSLKFVSSLSRISTKCESIPAYKTYLHVTGIIVHFSELSRCFWKLNWSDSRSPSCFWLIELCERNKNLDPPLIFCWLRILWELSTSWFLLIGLILDPPLSSC